MADKKIATNRKARHDYHIIETYEAGIELKGTEVKSIRKGNVNLKESFARILHGELFLMNMHVNPYEQGNINNHDPLRNRKLLMHKKQINKFIGKLSQKGLSLVPLSLYLKRQKVKVELALAQGKKKHDKRESIKKRDIEREERRHGIRL